MYYPMAAETEAKLEASLPPRIASLIRRTENYVEPETGDPHTIYHYSPIKEVPNEIRNELDIAFAIFDAACRPAEHKELVFWLVRLHSATIARAVSQDDLELKLALYVDELSGFPGEIVHEVIRRACRGCRWWPPLADLLNEIERLSQRRLAMRACLWQMRQRHGALEHVGSGIEDAIKALADAMGMNLEQD